MNSSFAKVRGPQVWLAYLFLIVATLGPSICVLWLVRKTVESEKIVVERLVREAAALRLEKAEKSLLEELAARADAFGRSAGGEMDWDLAAALGARHADAAYVTGDPGPPLGGRFDTAAARSALADAREALRVAPRHGVGARARELLTRSDLTDLRFDDGRSVSAMLAELALARMEAERSVDGDFLALVEALTLARGEERLPLGQRNHLLRRIAPHSANPAIGALERSRRLSAEWMQEAQLPDWTLPDEPVLVTERFVALVNQERGFALLFRKRGFERRWLRDPVAGVTLALAAAPAEPPRDAQQDTSGPDARRALAPPLDWLELRASAAEAGLAADPRRPTLAYIWIGGIVLTLSIVSGGATVLFIRGQLSAAQLKNDLVATVSHELKTPVASIRLLVDTLRDAAREGQVDREEYLALIDRENRRLGHLIDNFLSFSRLERNKRSFDLRPLRPEEVVREAEVAFRDRFKDREFDLQVQVEPGVPRILGDREAIWTAVGNLLENALKYGGDVKRIEFRLRRGKSGARFEVQDFGRGIARKDRKRIFNRFYQADRDHGGHSGSVGLGLSIVEFVVSSHNGAVELESEVGQGSVFTITIPYA